MVVSLLQPYFFPYLGYFQLIAASDVFVIYDDAQFMKNGWVNRNRILGDPSPAWWTFPVEAASHKLPINQRRYVDDRSRNPASLLAALHHRYRRAPHFAPAMRLVEDILAFGERGVAAFNANAIRQVCRQLGIDTRMEVASTLGVPPSGGEERVLDICKALGATRYLNPIGGTELYSPVSFAARGLALEFLHSEVRPYRQFTLPFQPALSVIDTLMFNGPAEMRELLAQYRIVRGGDITL
jgi:hypothetical protein